MSGFETRLREAPPPLSASVLNQIKRDRSPNFPSIGLGRALERTDQFYKGARRYEVRLADAAAAWGMGAKSSGTLQTVAALLAYGLLEDGSSGESRKIKISDLGWRILEDGRPGVREKGLADAALKPRLIADYAEIWKEGRPDDKFCISELKIERGFTEDAAARFLNVFDETIQFARPASPDIISDSKRGLGEGRNESPSPPPPIPKLKVGDYVQWNSGGIDQFKAPHRVEGFFDANHARVFGSITGIPVSELTVVASPAPPTAMAKTAPQKTPSPASEVLKNIDVLMLGAGRLQITAEVNKAGLSILRKMLDKYEEILDLLEMEVDLGGRIFDPVTETWSEPPQD